MVVVFVAQVNFSPTFDIIKLATPYHQNRHHQPQPLTTNTLTHSTHLYPSPYFTAFIHHGTLT